MSTAATATNGGRPLSFGRSAGRSRRVDAEGSLAQYREPLVVASNEVEEGRADLEAAVPGYQQIGSNESNNSNGNFAGAGGTTAANSSVLETSSQNDLSEYTVNTTVTTN